MDKIVFILQKNKAWFFITISEIEDNIKEILYLGLDSQNHTLRILIGEHVRLFIFQNFQFMIL